MSYDQPRPRYVPPPGDEDPLDAIQEALVRMWVDIIADEIRDELANEPPVSSRERGGEAAQPRESVGPDK